MKNSAQPIRVVFDSNVFLAAIFGRKKAGLGPARQAFELARRRRIHLIASPDIFHEVARVLSDKFGWSAGEKKDAIRVMRQAVKEYIKPKVSLAVVSHESDNRVLECAVSAKADLIVSGDHRLKALKTYRGLAIISTADLMHMFS